MGLKRNALALYLPKPPAELCIFTEHVVDSMENSDWFPNPTPSLVMLKAGSDALKTATAATRGPGDGTVAERNVVQKELEDLLIQEKAYVQEIINKNPASALVIAQAGGMSLRQHTPVHKAALGVKQSPDLTQALVIAKAVGRGAAYEWQYSLDGGQTWVTLGLTTSAHIILPGITMGATYWFRLRTLVQDKMSEWSSSISFTAR